MVVQLVHATIMSVQNGVSGLESCVQLKAIHYEGLLEMQQGCLGTILDEINMYCIKMVHTKYAQLWPCNQH